MSNAPDQNDINQAMDNALSEENEGHGFLEKAAILMVGLESHSPGITNKIFSHIGEMRSKKMLKAIARIGKVSANEMNHIIEEFYGAAIEQKIVFGGKNMSAKILKETFGIEQQDEYFSDKTGLFDFLAFVTDESLLKFFESENNQMAALILYYLNEERMAGLMSQLPLERSSVISQLILEMDIPSTHLIYRMQSRLEDRLLSTEIEYDVQSHQSLVKLARVLEMMSPEARDRVMGVISESNPDSVVELRKLVFTFDKISCLTDKDIQTILYEVNPLKMLAVALLTIDQNLKSRIMTNVSERVRLMLTEEIDLLPDDLPEEAIIKAQNDIVQLIRRIEKEGKIDKLSNRSEQPIMGDSAVGDFSID